MKTTLTYRIVDRIELNLDSTIQFPPFPAKPPQFSGYIN